MYSFLRKSLRVSWIKLKLASVGDTLQSWLRGVTSARSWLLGVPYIRKCFSIEKKYISKAITNISLICFVTLWCHLKLEVLTLWCHLHCIGMTPWCHLHNRVWLWCTVGDTVALHNNKVWKHLVTPLCNLHCGGWTPHGWWLQGDDYKTNEGLPQFLKQQSF